MKRIPELSTHRLWVFLRRLVLAGGLKSPHTTHLDSLSTEDPPSFSTAMSGDSSSSIFNHPTVSQVLWFVVIVVGCVCGCWFTCCPPRCCKEDSVHGNGGNDFGYSGGAGGDFGGDCGADCGGDCGGG